MTRLLITVVVALLGFAAVRVWAPRYERALEGGALGVSRAEAIAVVQAAAREAGLDTAGWHYAAAVDWDGRLRTARRALQSPLLEEFTPLTVQVSAISPDRMDSLQATLRDDGHLQALRTFSARQRPRGPGAYLEELSQVAMTRYLGKSADQYQQTLHAAGSQEGYRSAWERVDPSHPGVLARFEVLQRDGVVVRAEHRAEIAAFALPPPGGLRQRTPALAVLAVTFFWFCLFLGVWGLFRGLVQHARHFRMGLAAILLGSASLLLGLLTGDVLNRLILESSDKPQAAVAVMTSLALGLALPQLLCAGALAAGAAFLPVFERPSWISIRLLSQGRLFARPVARDLAAGVALGFCMPAMLLLPAVTGIAKDRPGILEMNGLMSALPLLPAIDPSLQMTLLFPLAVALPWCLSFRRWRWPLLAPLIPLCAAVWVPSTDVYREIPLALSLAFPLLFLAISYLIYRTWGLLAAWVFPASAKAFYTAVILQHAPARDLQDAGTGALAVLVGGLAALVVFGWKGEEVDEQEVLGSWETAEARLTKSERERLRASFSVARRAQLGMLPAAAPKIPGYTLSASCISAREVGGDLFDFLNFAHGEIGLCVADVSGKGVPAALYMTMVKGMLAAAESEPADLALVLRRLNEHMRAWGGKRTFVTMSLALLEPESGLVRHARAGHNSPLLLRGRQATYLQPRGMGLGIAGSALFDRNLEIEEIRLAPADILILYSDGLVECMNPAKELYGEQRLQRLVEDNAHLDAGALEALILQDAKAFQGKAEAHDDLTILVLRREPVSTSGNGSGLRYEGQNNMENLRVH